MAFNPMDFFEAGTQIGKSRKSPFAYGASNVMDQFKSNMETEAKLTGTLGEQMALKRYERSLPPSAKDQSSIDLDNARTNRLNNPASTNPSEAPAGMILDRVGPTGPTYVNQQARIDLAGARKYAANKATIDPLVQSGENVLKTSVGAFKQMAAANPMGAGRGAGVLNWLGGVTGNSPAVNAYNGLKVETSTELAKIANPSGRGGPEIQKEFEKLLPNNFSTWDEFANKFHYAAQNAFARQAAYNNIPYNPADYEGRIQEILDTPAFEQMHVGNILQNASSAQRADVAPDASSTSNAPATDEDAIFKKLKAKYGG